MIKTIIFKIKEVVSYLLSPGRLTAGKGLLIFLSMGLMALVTQGCQGHHKQARSERPEDSVELTVSTIALPRKDREQKPAWGYEIYAGNSLYVRQLNVPAISGNFGFANPQDAKKVAGLVIDKLKKGQPPTLTLQDIADAGVRVIPVL